MITRHLLIEGLVQGVGYRAAMQVEADRLGLTGWVRNRTDGSVEAVAQGLAESVECIIAWARHGPPAARVCAIHVATTQPESEGRYTRFEQLPTT
ncbi:MAG: acylphosphatase [Burkholderiales bacterium]